jgi:alcohol dehydrogenase
MPIMGRAAVMTAAGADLEFRGYPVPQPGPGAILARVTCCTICRSDLHTWSGRRPAPTPMILGHEIVGRALELGDGVTHDVGDRPLAVGDRISWTLTDSCGRCAACRTQGLPMKCRALRKYGHDRCEAAPHFTGGFAEYCLLGPGTSVVRLPDALTDEEACPANCALATVVAGWEAAELPPGAHVLIQGAGALGMYAAALARHAGCDEIIVTDVQEHRLETIRAFGATCTLNTARLADADVVRAVRERTGGRGVDAALEVAGSPGIVPLGLKCLRTGGRYVEQGCAFPGAQVVVDVSDLLFRRLKIVGVHNYDARHLDRGIAFLALTKDRFPFHRLVTHRFPLADINAALRVAQSEEAIRVAVLP